MQFPRYELVVLSAGEDTRPRPRPEPRPRPRDERRVRRLRPLRRTPELDIHQYLELEFAVDDRR
jgi:hypothetical protein